MQLAPQLPASVADKHLNTIEDYLITNPGYC